MSKFVAVILVGMLVVGTCFAEHRRGVLGGVYGQEQRQRARKGKNIEGYYKEINSFKFPERSVDNHHSIPRQYYNNDPDNGDNGAAAGTP